MRRDGRAALRTSVLACAVGAVLGTHCKKDPVDPVLAPHASASAAPIDRLSPDELGPGEEDLFGLRVPRGMAVQGKFRDFAIATGNVRADAVANYVRENVAVERVEIGAARTIFPAARLKGTAEARTYRIEVLEDGPATRLTVWDLTPPPPAPAPPPGVTTDELWRRAGFSRDGKPLDTKSLE